MSDIDTITARIEALPGWAEAKEEYYKGSKRAPDKYFRTKSWVEDAFRRWKALDFLDTPLKVLDIGAGFGYFAIVGSQQGNQIELADVPNPMFDAVTLLLGLSKHELEVRSFTPIQLQGSYDLVTAYRVVFDKDWTEGEWRFFLRDIHNSLLNEGGSIVLGFNNKREKRFMKWAEPMGARYISKHDVLVPYGMLNE